MNEGRCVCVFSYGLKQQLSVRLYRKVTLLSGSILVCVSRSSGEQYAPSPAGPHPSYSAPSFTHSNPLVLIWSCWQLDWWLVEEKNILIETHTCAGLHTQLTRLALSISYVYTNASAHTHINRYTYVISLFSACIQCVCHKKAIKIIE